MQSVNISTQEGDEMKDFAKGLVVASMCAAIAYGVHITRSAHPLWALFFVAVVVELLFCSKKG